MPISTMHKDNRPELIRTLTQTLNVDGWVVACLCAAWCGSCNEYATTFTALAKRHPSTQFVWIDIEDHADLIGDLDIENFPTLLMQRGHIVTFLAPAGMDLQQAERIFLAQQEKNVSELCREAQSSEERRGWQTEANLLLKMQQLKN